MTKARIWPWTLLIREHRSKPGATIYLARGRDELRLLYVPNPENVRLAYNLLQAALSLAGDKRLEFEAEIGVWLDGLLEDPNRPPIHIIQRRVHRGRVRRRRLHLDAEAEKSE